MMNGGLSLSLRMMPVRFDALVSLSTHFTWNECMESLLSSCYSRLTRQGSIASIQIVLSFKTMEAFLSHGLHF